jgi:hypothetical protein
VIITPSYRSKGVSDFILKTMAEFAVQKYRAKELHLTCFNTNTPGLSLYLRSGFTPYAMEKRQDFEGKPLLAIHLKKALDRISVDGHPLGQIV